MKRIKIAGLCLVAVLAMSALATAGAAAAEPEYMLCAKAKGGNYEKGCATKSAPGQGKAELELVESGVPYTGKGKGATITVGSKTVKCKKSTDEGEVSSAGVGGEEITFSGCGLNGNKKEPCTTAGESAGTIRTGRLTSLLRYDNSGETEIGVALLNFGGPFAEFDCGSEAVELYGVVIGALENTKKGVTVTLAVSGGEQQLQHFWSEGEEDGPFTLSTPSEEKATLEMIEAQGPKGIGAYPF